MANKYQSLRGMNDVLPHESTKWQYVEQVMTEWASCYGYQQIRTPILEPTALFVRSIGEVTDIVEKEMYTFIDSLNNESMTLRPEGTAACLRAALQHNLLYNQSQRLWYMGPMFRHERPQKGRYRQFHQLGVEIIGFEGPDADVEVIAMTQDLWQRLGLQRMRLEINSLGNKEERLAHRAKLITYLEQHVTVLDEEAKRRLYTNPLRVLDSKNPTMQEIAQHAPQLLACLGKASRAHFDNLRALLEHMNIAYTINPRLVRGLDYYNLTVFEWVTDALGAQGTICAGGRYDGLIEELGGKPMAAVGFAMGIERLLLLMEHEKVTFPEMTPDVYIVRQGEKAVCFAFTVAQSLRQLGKKVMLHCGEGSFKAQMKKADASGARYAVIIGDDEVQQDKVTLKALRTTEEQITVATAQLIHHI
jgi:histidyl-tRNA synthetase